MSHYEERLEEDLTRIRERVTAVATRVDEAVARAVSALLAVDRHVASDIILGDMPINREIRAIDRECHAFVARHLPSAGHLRFVSSVLRLNVAIERIGDYAVTIARVTARLGGPPLSDMTRDIELMAQHAKRMLGDARRAFQEQDVELARATKAVADAANLFGRGFDDLTREGEAHTRPIGDLFSLFTVFNMLERVIDQTKNMCEETIFVVTGETKAPKLYRILFVDERNDGASQLAEAYTRKAFPQSGVYESAGWEPAPSLNSACAAFIGERGIDTSELHPKSLEAVRGKLADYHVIVSLGGNPRPHITDAPFRTVFLEWEVGQTDTTEHIDAAFKELAHRVRDLMETLRGDQAN